jgi:hypothetical protein
VRLRSGSTPPNSLCSTVTWSQFDSASLQCRARRMPRAGATSHRNYRGVGAHVVRIVALILIGVRYRALAIGGFHSAAGWILFNALSFGIVAVSWQFEGLGKAPPNAKSRRIDAAFYLAPLLAIAATGMIIHAL